MVNTLKKIKNVKNSVTFDFTDLFNNIDLSDLKVINSRFTKYKNQLNFPHCVNVKYYEILTNFIIRNYL